MGRPKITYNSIDLNFPTGAGAQNLEINLIENNKINRSDGGLSRIVTHFQDKIICFDLPYYSRDFENELRALYDYCRDGSTCKLIIDSDIGLYIPFEGKSLITNDKEAATFTRTGVANVVDAYTGLVTSVAATTGRYPSGKFTGASLLIEDAVTNWIDDTEDLSGAGWTNVVSTDAATTLPDPAGSVVSKVIELTSTGGPTSAGTFYRSANDIAANSLTFTIYAKVLSGTVAGDLIIARSDTSATLSTVAITLTTEWQRFVLSYTTAGTLGAGIKADTYFLYDVAGAAEVAYVTMAQLEPKLYETTYIKDAGTRNAETLYYDLDTDNFDPKKWSISYWCYIAWPNVAGTNRRSFTIYDNAGSDESIYQEMSTSGSFNTFVKVYGAGANLVSDSVTGSLLTIDTWHHMVITFDSTISNGLKHYLDGTLVETSTNDSGVPEVPDRLYIGSSQAGANQWNGMIDDFMIHKKVLTVTEILDHYNSGIGWGTQENIFDDVYLNNYSWKTMFVNGAKRKTASLEFINKIT